MVGVLYKVKDKCTEVVPSIGIDYQLYMMATPVQYIIQFYLHILIKCRLTFGGLIILNIALPQK